MTNLTWYNIKDMVGEYGLNSWITSSLFNSIPRIEENYINWLVDGWMSKWGRANISFIHLRIISGKKVKMGNHDLGILIPQFISGAEFMGM